MKTLIRPLGSVGKPFSKYLRLNKLDDKKVQEVKIITPWPGMMKNVINGKPVEQVLGQRWKFQTI